MALEIKWQGSKKKNSLIQALETTIADHDGAATTTQVVLKFTAQPDVTPGHSFPHSDRTQTEQVTLRKRSLYKLT